MKKSIFAVVLICLLSACSKDSFLGSGSIISDNRNVAYFDAISSEGTFNVVITKGNEQTIKIIADDNVMPRVRTDVENDRLKLFLKDGNYRNVHLEAHITVLDLKSVANSGTGDISIYGNTQQDIFNVFNSGTATIYLEGSCDKLSITNEGSGAIQAYDMPSNTCSIKNEGSGEIQVRCATNLDISLEGSGNVYYKGSPEINTQVLGSGEIINSN